MNLALLTDLEKNVVEAYRSVYAELGKLPIKLMLTTYFDSIVSNLELAVELGTAGIHVDLVRAPDQLKPLLAALNPNQFFKCWLCRRAKHLANRFQHCIIPSQRCSVSDWDRIAFWLLHPAPCSMCLTTCTAKTSFLHGSRAGYALRKRS